jgi:CRP-like cAMP-binding protein
MATPNDVSVEATSPGLVWAVSREDFSRVAAQHPGMARDLYEELTEELAAAENAVEV